MRMETPYTVAAAVLATVQAALEAAERPVGRTLVAVGAFVVDDCCAGHLAVAPERVWRTTARWPDEAGADEVCGENPIAVSLLVRIDRCVPVVLDNGDPPPSAQVEAAHSGVLTDAAIIWNTLAGDDVLGDDGTGYALWERASLSQDFVAAEGGCVGVETRVTFGIPAESWCE